jgi:hypothetical protein
VADSVVSTSGATTKHAVFGVFGLELGHRRGAWGSGACCAGSGAAGAEDGGAREEIEALAGASEVGEDVVADPKRVVGRNDAVKDTCALVLLREKAGADRVGDRLVKE